MKRACIAIVDGTSARLYTYEQPDGQEPTLEEQKDLVNVERRAKDEEVFSTTKPGDRYQEGGRGSTDDHRDNHRAHHDALFAGEVMDEIHQLVKAQRLGHVILVASPRMLGNLRQFEAKLEKEGILVDEIQRDLTKLTSPQIHDHLAGLDIIAPRGRVTFVRR